MNAQAIVVTPESAEIIDFPAPGSDEAQRAALRTAVGGYFQLISERMTPPPLRGEATGQALSLFCDEEGMCKSDPVPNPFFPGIVGNVFIAGTKGMDVVGLKEEAIQNILGMLERIGCEVKE